MVVYRLLGSGVTDANGVASVNYTGAGAGEMDFIASTSNPIDESSLVSETFALIDATWIDYATQENHRDVWYNHANTRSERKSEYTELTENGGNLIYRLASQYGFSKENICIEYDIFQVDGISANGTSAVFNSNGSLILSNPLSSSNMNIGEWNHMKLEFQGSNGVKINGTLRSYASAPTDKLLFGFLTNGDCTTVRFKNVAIYPI